MPESIARAVRRTLRLAGDTAVAALPDTLRVRICVTVVAPAILAVDGFVAESLLVVAVLGAGVVEAGLVAAGVVLAGVVGAVPPCARLVPMAIEAA